MKRMFIFICLVLALGSCDSKSGEIKYDQYELGEYNGYVVTGKFMSDSEGVYNLTLHLDSICYTSVMVSEKTFKRHTLGDAINVVRPVEEAPVDTTSEVQKAQFEVKLMNVYWAGHTCIATNIGGVEHDWATSHV